MMAAAEACLLLVEELPSSLVEALIAQLRGSLPVVMTSPGYQGRVEEFLSTHAGLRRELAGMLVVAMASKRTRVATDLVWTGPPTSAVPTRRTEQVLFEVIE